MSEVSGFQVGAALWVVRAVDQNGSDRATLDQAFRHAATQGRFSRTDLDNAVKLLLERDILVVQSDRIYRQPSLRPLLSLADESAISLLAELLRTAEVNLEADDNALRNRVGALGEEAVVAWCVKELRALGHRDLAIHVQRVSLVSDRFGYDISAPLVTAGVRMLEVKSMGSVNHKTFRFFLTRNEYEVGRRHPRDWALVACRASDESTDIIGWCRISELERYLPDDANGRWTEALVHLPIRAFLPNVPSAIP